MSQLFRNGVCEMWLITALHQQFEALKKVVDRQDRCKFSQGIQILCDLVHIENVPYFELNRDLSNTRKLVFDLNLQHKNKGLFIGYTSIRLEVIPTFGSIELKFKTKISDDDHTYLLSELLRELKKDVTYEIY